MIPAARTTIGVGWIAVWPVRIRNERDRRDDGGEDDDQPEARAKRAGRRRRLSSAVSAGSCAVAAVMDFGEACPWLRPPAMRRAQQA